MQTEVRDRVEKDCERTILSFYAALDGKRYEELAGLFLDDGVWHRLGTALAGPKQILAAMQGRQSWVTVHIVTNVLVTALTPSEATSQQYVTIYRLETIDGETPPFPIAAPIGISVHRDQLVLTEAGWRFREKKSRAVMADTSRVDHYHKR